MEQELFEFTDELIKEVDNMLASGKEIEDPMVCQMYTVCKMFKAFEDGTDEKIFKKVADEYHNELRSKMEKIMSENKVVWHPYPKEKPDEDKLYLVTLEDNYGEKTVVIRGFWNNTFTPFAPIKAWAELPEPYKEEENEQEIQKDKE